VEKKKQWRHFFSSRKNSSGLIYISGKTDKKK